PDRKPGSGLAEGMLQETRQGIEQILKWRARGSLDENLGRHAGLEFEVAGLLEGVWRKFDVRQVVRGTGLVVRQAVGGDIGYFSRDRGRDALLERAQPHVRVAA